MFFNYHMLIFSDYCTNPNFQFWMGTSYCVHIGVVVIVNIAFMLTNTIEKSKRKSKLDKLRVAQAIMIAEFKANKQKKSLLLILIIQIKNLFYQTKMQIPIIFKFQYRQVLMMMLLLNFNQQLILHPFLIFRKHIFFKNLKI